MSASDVEVAYGSCSLKSYMFAVDRCTVFLLLLKLHNNARTQIDNSEHVLHHTPFLLSVQDLHLCIACRPLSDSELPDCESPSSYDHDKLIMYTYPYSVLHNLLRTAVALSQCLYLHTTHCSNLQFLHPNSMALWSWCSEAFK